MPSCLSLSSLSSLSLLAPHTRYHHFSMPKIRNPTKPYIKFSISDRAPPTKPPKNSSWLSPDWLTTLTRTLSIGGQDDSNIPIANAKLEYVSDLLGGALFLPLFQWTNEYGPIYRLAAGPRNFVIVGDPEIAKHVLRNYGTKYTKGLVAEVSEFLFGSGFSIAEDSLWTIGDEMQSHSFPIYLDWHPLSFADSGPETVRTYSHTSFSSSFSSSSSVSVSTSTRVKSPPSSYCYSGTSNSSFPSPSSSTSVRISRFQEFLACSRYYATSVSKKSDSSSSDDDDDSFSGEIEDIEIEIEKIDKNSRRIQSKVAVDAGLETVWSILTDYERLADFIPSLAVSEVLDKKDNFTRLFQLVGEQNLAFGLKFKAQGVVDCYEKDLEILPLGQRRREIEFQMIEGDFRLFQGKWSIQQLSTGTNELLGSLSRGGGRLRTTLSYVVDVEPKMWLPVQLVESRLCTEIKLNLSCIRKAAHKAVGNIPLAD